jgi:hypothetical protein
MKPLPAKAKRRHRSHPGRERTEDHKVVRGSRVDSAVTKYSRRGRDT